LKFGNMSKVGRNPIIIPEGVTIQADERQILVKGPKGELKTPVLDGVKAVLNEKELSFEVLRNSKQAKSNWGTTRALAANAVKGVQGEFEKTLVLEGVGFRVMKEGEGLVLNLGFSHPVKREKVPGIEFEVEKNNTLKIKGADKSLVGKIAAEIRALKKPEPYKGKGFRYSDEVIRRKAGKKAGSSE